MVNSKDNQVEVRPSHPDCPFVTKVLCSTRTRAARWVLGLLFGVLGVFLVLVVYTANQSEAANNNYIHMAEAMSTLNSEVATHKPTQRAVEAAILEKLNEVKKELVEQRHEQRALLERILELQIEVATRAGVAP